MEEHRKRVAEIVSDPATAEILKPYYRYLCKRPCFHDEYLDAYNLPNVTLVDCPAGFDRVTEQGPVVGGQQYEVDCLIYGTGFEPETTPLPRRIGQELVGRGGLTLADKWTQGAATLFGMMSRGFPNLFVMPAPAQQGVVTVNYTHLAVLGAEFVARHRRPPRPAGREGVRRERRGGGRLGRQDRVGYVDGSHVMAACTPSRINNEGNPQGMDPRNGNYGRGFGDYFAFRDLLEGWLEAGDFEGLELDTRPVDRDDDRPVVVVTGGGAGIGAAVAEELGRQGWHVVTVDPLVSLDGSEPLPAPEETTAGRIVAAGGAAQASSASVTDARRRPGPLRGARRRARSARRASSTSPASPGRPASRAGPRTTGAACSRSTSTATSTCSERRSR